MLVQLFATLDAPVPAPEIKIEPFVLAQDVSEVLALNNAAFEGHPDQGNWSEDKLKSRMHEPWFDPKGLLLHRENGKIIAFCWTKIVDGVGELFVVGVHPDYQRKHFGLNIARAGLQHLQQLGINNAMLWVDETNAAAMGLYKSLGFN